MSKEGAAVQVGGSSGGFEEVQDAQAGSTARIRVLTIGAQQVTRAIFGQLPEEPIVADDGSLMGVPWGRVLLHPEGCDRRDHIHVLWERDGDLRQARFVLDIDAAAGLAVHTGAEADRYLTAWIREACRGREDFPASLSYAQSGARVLNVVFEAEAGVWVQAFASAAATRAVAARTALFQAREAVSRPIDRSDMHIYAVAEWRQRNPELAAIIVQALEAGVAISTSPELDVRLARMQVDSEAASPLRAHMSGLRMFLKVGRGAALEKESAARQQWQEAVDVLNVEVDDWGVDWQEICAAYRRQVQTEAVRRRDVRRVRELLARLPQIYVLD